MSITTDGSQRDSDRPYARAACPGRGRESSATNTVHVRVWARRPSDVDVVVEGRAGRSSTAKPNGYFSGQTEGRAGDRYGFRVNGRERLYPDPASRFQPDGPHGLSEIVDPNAFQWTDRAWRGVSLEGQVLYELHTGTFTPAGDVAAAARELAELADARDHRRSK